MEPKRTEDEIDEIDIDLYYIDCPELPLDSFDYDRAAICLGFDIRDAWDLRNKTTFPGFVLIGKADASKIRIRPKTGTVLMVEDEDGERTWFHVPYTYVSEKEKRRVQRNVKL